MICPGLDPLTVLLWAIAYVRYRLSHPTASQVAMEYRDLIPKISRGDFAPGPTVRPR